MKHLLQETKLLWLLISDGSFYPLRAFVAKKETPHFILDKENVPQKTPTTISNQLSGYYCIKKDTFI